MSFGKNPADTLMQISGGQCVSRALHVMADLGIADALGDVPQTAATLAAATATHPDTLRDLQHDRQKSLTPRMRARKLSCRVVEPNLQAPRSHQGSEFPE
jgi:hypothetical protein